MSVKKQDEIGKRYSTTSNGRQRKPVFPTTALKELLSKIYDEARDGEPTELGPEQYARRRHDFIFHMTDWLSDLDRLSKLYKYPDEADLEQATVFMIGFLYHVIPHLTTAGRLLLDRIGDPFANDWSEQKSETIAKKKHAAKKVKVSL